MEQLYLTKADIPTCRRFTLLPCEVDLAMSIKGAEENDNTCRHASVESGGSTWPTPLGEELRLKACCEKEKQSPLGTSYHIALSCP